MENNSFYNLFTTPLVLAMKACNAGPRFGNSWGVAVQGLGFFESRAWGFRFVFTDSAFADGSSKFRFLGVQLWIWV